MSHGHQLLRLLSDGQLYSGEWLGDSLGISRAGVWKQLRGLRERGVAIHSVPGKGYRLAGPLELLDTEAIVAGLPKATRRRVGLVEIHYELDSTNSEWLRRAAGLPDGAVCLAETQRAGRGRQNRTWVSACGRSLCLSLLWRFSRGPDALGGLGLVIGLAVLRAVDDIGVEGAGLKWPNDVLWQGAKLAGSLIELSGESGGSACAVIGVGVNIDLPRTAGEGIDQPWTDLATACGGRVSRNRFAGRLIHRLVEALSDFDGAGLGVFLDEWGRRDLLSGREVSVHTLAGIESGIARGVDAGGALLVESGGRVRRHLAGDVSVRSKGSRPP